MDLYLIPGLGADRRLFDRLDLAGHQVHHLEWPEIVPGTTIGDLARMFAGHIVGDKPHALIGVSMGGMVAQELAAITHPQRTIIISSWKGPQEMPWSLRLLRGTHPERILTSLLLKQMLPLVRWEMGVERPDDVELFNALINVHPVEQLKAQINACLLWNGPAQPVQELVHIHGDQDRLMPLSHVQGARPIPGGSHFMVFNRAHEVSEAVEAALRAASTPH